MPTYIVNGRRASSYDAGHELAPPSTRKPSADWQKVTTVEFQAHMGEKYGVTYNDRGAWTHITAAQRAAR